MPGDLFWRSGPNVSQSMSVLLLFWGGHVTCHGLGQVWLIGGQTRSNHRQKTKGSSSIFTFPWRTNISGETNYCILTEVWDCVGVFCDSRFAWLACCQWAPPSPAVQLKFPLFFSRCRCTSAAAVRKIMKQAPKAMNERILGASQYTASNGKERAPRHPEKGGSNLKPSNLGLEAKCDRRV